MYEEEKNFGKLPIHCFFIMDEEVFLKVSSFETKSGTRNAVSREEKFVFVPDDKIVLIKKQTGK